MEPALEGFGAIRVAIADPALLLRAALRSALSCRRDLLLVGEAGDGFAAVDLVRRARPEVLLLEVWLPGKDGYDTLRDVLALGGATRVLIATLEPEPHHALRLLRAGAQGVFSKAADVDELARAVRAVRAGRVYLPAELQRTFAEWHVRPANGDSPAAAISEREHQVLRLLALGGSNQEIAGRLFVSVKTVDSHRANLLRKLNLRNNADLTRFALLHGIIRV